MAQGSAPLKPPGYKGMEKQREGERKQDEIRKDIELTRNRMEGTLKAIEQRFFPIYAADRIYKAVEKLKTGISKKIPAKSGKKEGVGRTALEKIRMHPIPSALAGAGIGWLIIAIFRENGKLKSSAHSEESHFQATELYRGKNPSVKSPDPAKYRHKTGSIAQIRLREKTEGLRRMMNANPLAVAAAAMALGAFIGFGIPGPECNQK